MICYLNGFNMHSNFRLGTEFAVLDPSQSIEAGAGR